MSDQSATTNDIRTLHIPRDAGELSYGTRAWAHQLIRRVIQHYAGNHAYEGTEYTRETLGRYIGDYFYFKFANDPLVGSAFNDFRLPDGKQLISELCKASYDGPATNIRSVIGQDAILNFARQGLAENDVRVQWCLSAMKRKLGLSEESKDLDGLYSGLILVLETAGKLPKIRAVARPDSASPSFLLENAPFYNQLASIQHQGSVLSVNSKDTISAAPMQSLSKTTCRNLARHSLGQAIRIAFTAFVPYPDAPSHLNVTQAMKLTSRYGREAETRPGAGFQHSISVRDSFYMEHLTDAYLALPVKLDFLQDVPFKIANSYVSEGGRTGLRTRDIPPAVMDRLEELSHAYVTQRIEGSVTGAQDCAAELLKAIGIADPQITNRLVQSFEDTVMRYVEADAAKDRPR